ncbi:hypothetical protein FSARC_12114 [Fusarium sarcochroum]|uniref:Uncharacterized protein n=1 Tax=Fusarium sarcochroum TaxID=1208366 RepID=A0A8H4TB15_9HYPO|nr:hypothetical protein FSARC_12114 [Fusarium sarcochroum]
MTTYAQLQRDPISKDIFNKRVTTLKGFLDVVKSSSFFAIDTEYAAVQSETGPIFHQVGLAYYRTLVHPADDTSISSSKPSLRVFHGKIQMRALTLNVDVSKEKHDELIRLRGAPGLPVRRSLRFGQEQQVDLESLEATIVNFVQRCDSKRNLV